jgi:tRNA pseudouridine55 synthase
MNGLLLVDKPAGITSHDVVARLRRATDIKRIGHAGTLDPFATGLMLVLLGRATRLSQFFLTMGKEYRLRLRLGEESDTLDVTGKILRRIPDQVSEEQFRKAREIFESVLNSDPDNVEALKALRRLRDEKGI